MALLEIDGLSVRFGGLRALSGVSLSVEEGSIVAVIGPNGAGKTTLFNVITGVCAASEGQVRLDGKRLDGTPPHVICARGVARTFQNIRLFRSLSVLENIQAALLGSERSGWRDVLRGSGWRLRESQRRARALELLEQLGLAHLADNPANSLPYGEQRRLEIARALASGPNGPRILLLDEPAAGTNPSEKEALRLSIAEIKKQFSLTVLLIDHDIPFVMNLAQRVAVLDHGEKIAEGTPDKVRLDPKVIEAYLGPDDEGPHDHTHGASPAGSPRSVPPSSAPAGAAVSPDRERPPVESVGRRVAGESRKGASR